MFAEVVEEPLLPSSDCPTTTETPQLAFTFANEFGLAKIRYPRIVPLPVSVGAVQDKVIEFAVLLLSATEVGSFGIEWIRIVPVSLRSAHPFAMLPSLQMSLLVEVWVENLKFAAFCFWNP
jgi:hypothetical protein